MKIAIVGLGGVGGYLAGSLTKNSKNKVVSFARGEHLRAIQKNGIEIVEDDKSYSVTLDARELSDANGYFDMVLFCVKSYDLQNSYKAIKNHIDANSILISFSNGVTNGDKLREISDSIVLDGCMYILSHIEKAGVIRKKGKVFAGVFGGDTDATHKLASVFEEALLRYKIPLDIKTAIWKKYIFISAFATLTSYYDKSIGYVYEYYKDEAEAVLKEIVDFASTKGIDLSDEIQKSLDTASKVPYDSSTSMHRDFQNKKQTELDSLTKYIDTPLMQKMYNQLKKRD
ncbi:MAG: 2-dehydropantoate 2-reductase [Campylobacterota bacterium]|nr:2-dehydropantoate 2-reductase [Campylobacterota bacterium]